MTHSTSLQISSPANGQLSQIVENSAVKATATTVNTLSANIQHLECRTDSEVQMAMEKFSHLKSLRLTGDICDFLWTTMPNLTHLTIDGLLHSDGGFLRFMTAYPGGRCPKLQHLIVKDCPAFNEFTMDAIGCIAAVMPVNQITLTNPKGISVLGVKWLREAMPKYSGKLSIIDERIQMWERGGYRVPEDLVNPDVRLCSNYQSLLRMIEWNKEQQKQLSS